MGNDAQRRRARAEFEHSVCDRRLAEDRPRKARERARRMLSRLLAPCAKEIVDVSREREMQNSLCDAQECRARAISAAN